MATSLAVRIPLGHDCNKEACPSGWCRSAGPQLGSELAPAATAGS